VNERVAGCGVSASTGEPTLDARNEIASWFREYRRSILGFFSRYHISRVSAEDLTHEVFVRVLRWHKGRAVESPLEYLRRISRNVLVELSKAQGRRERLLALWFEDQLADEQQRILHSDAKCDMRADLIASIAALPVRQRRLVTLLLEEGPLTYRALAKRLGISERMVLRDITKAYSTLRSSLADYDFSEKDRFPGRRPWRAGRSSRALA
jgi:RNA polymerase sigma-70 factor (ECF subfamily)